MDRANYHSSRLDCSDQLKSGSISKITLGYSIAKDIDQLIIELVEQILHFENVRKEIRFLITGSLNSTLKLQQYERDFFFKAYSYKDKE